MKATKYTISHLMLDCAYHNHYNNLDKFIDTFWSLFSQEGGDF